MGCMELYVTKVKKNHGNESLRDEAAKLNVDLDESKLSAKETRKLFKRGNLALHNNNYPLAAKHFFKAWEADSDNLYLLTVVSHLLTKLGHQAVAIEFLEKAIALHGVTEDICKVMGDMALSLEMYAVAEKIFGHAVQFNPAEEKYYINIARCLEGQGKVQDAIAFMKEVVKVLDQSSDCWSMLATLIKGHFAAQDSHEYFEKALDINPDNIVALNNYAGCLGERPYAIELSRRAIAIDSKQAEPHVLLASQLLQKGLLAEGWEHYEYRNDPSRGVLQTVQYTHGLQIWNKEPLEDKSIFLAAEQGIGDEMFFLSGVQHFIELGAEVHVGCDARLISIVERSFPNVKAYSYEDTIVNGVRYRDFPDFDKALKKKSICVDYALPIGSIPFHFWKKREDIPSPESGYFIADPDKQELWTKRFSSFLPKVRVGISWRSGHADEKRHTHNVGLERMLPIIRRFNAEFVCLQYDYTQEELEYIEQETGKSIHVWPEVDLREDIESNLSIIDNVDIVVGPCIAPQMLSMAAGKETMLICWGRPWWDFGQEKTILSPPHAPKAEFYEMLDGLRWNELVLKVLYALKDKFGQ